MTASASVTSNFLSGQDTPQRGSELTISSYYAKNPVLFMTFNRPAETSQVFSQIRKAKPKRLYVASDGARYNSKTDQENVMQVRQLVSEVDWDCEVFYLFQDVNLGCRDGCSSALRWFFEHEEQGVILEDDCLPTSTFFRFCDEMLERFSDDDEITIIGGTNVYEHACPVDSLAVRLHYPILWGWAGYRRLFLKYDTRVKIRSKLFLGLLLTRMHPMEKCFWIKMFLLLRFEYLNTWDFQLVFQMLVDKKKCIGSSTNLVSNIGFGEEATHTKNLNSTLSKLPVRNVVDDFSTATLSSLDDKKLNAHMSSDQFRCRNPLVIIGSKILRIIKKFRLS